MNRNAIHDRLNSTDRAVSPVIGVILMVAITVILAAVIGTFVLDLGQSAGNSAPQASLSVEADPGAGTSGEISLSHDGGDGLNEGQTRLLITNESSGTTAEWSSGTDGEVFSVGDTATVAAGATVSIDDTGPLGTLGGTSGDADTNGGAIAAVQSGTQYTVQLIDTDSQRVIFETTVTA